ncbi:tRNA dihydrouridine synthase [Helicobacter typhlonius]|uniref:tRNA-dihydrouridine synthase n=3 Tax=Helicobacter typhlonius TaxID=76936 RepID=A0A0S4PSA5_9HELI|nr:tRNA-dihydrouridine synthase [Helicobacter typhlonius]TLD78335.1 tRNA-dihydrouridine synthase [Helicobacter typhlonius]CUU39192.1 tRNA dihydrouridine synthase B [Helicobacter typhlonius]HCD73132.1 tRNA-dihydrouridine synthase [Helicobacter sp.]
MIRFDNLLMLAPLAGYTDLPFRSVVKGFGVDITVSEMISSHALVYNNTRTLKMIEKSQEEQPYSVQISGSKEEIIKKAVEILNEQEGIDIIDLNCGCPAPKVANHGNGSGLLKDLNLLVKIANLIKENAKTPYTSLKVRLGFDKKILHEIAQALKDVKSDFVVIHGRTRADGYKKERIDYDAIASIKAQVDLPVIANGEIDSASKAREVLERTGANGVMIGRAALSAPWIFWQIKHNTQEIPPIIKQELVLQHFKKMIDFYGERGAIMFRKNLHAYAKGHQGASEFRDLVNRLEDVKIIETHIEQFFSNNQMVMNAFPQLVHLNKRTS